METLSLLSSKPVGSLPTVALMGESLIVTSPFAEVMVTLPAAATSEPEMETVSIVIVESLAHGMEAVPSLSIVILPSSAVMVESQILILLTLIVPPEISAVQSPEIVRLPLSVILTSPVLAEMSEPDLIVMLLAKMLESSSIETVRPEIEILPPSVMLTLPSVAEMSEPEMQTLFPRISASSSETSLPEMETDPLPPEIVTSASSLEMVESPEIEISPLTSSVESEISAVSSAEIVISPPLLAILTASLGAPKVSIS